MRKQDEKLFLDIYNRYSRSVKNYIYFKVSDQLLAEDMEQETFLRVWQYMSGQQRKRIRKMKSFVFQVANNLIIDHYRQKDRSEIHLEHIPESRIRVEPSQVRDSEFAMDKARLEKHLKHLDEKYKKILALRFIKQASMDEVCKATGKSPNHISVLTHNGLKQLREKLMAGATDPPKTNPSKPTPRS